MFLDYLSVWSYRTIGNPQASPDKFVLANRHWTLKDRLSSLPQQVQHWYNCQSIEISLVLLSPKSQKQFQGV